MNGFWSIFRKELIHLARDRTTLVIAIMIPLMQMLLFGYAIDFDVRHISTVVVDLDQSRESRDYLQQLRATQYIDITAMTNSPSDAADKVRRGEAHVAVTIPPGFGRDQAAGRNPQVGVMLDGSDSQVSLRARTAFLRASRAPGEADPRITVLFNPNQRTAIYMIPGLVVVILQLVTVMLTAFSIVREKELGTLEQLMVTPVGRLGLMIGKILPYAILAMAEFVIVVLLADFVFGVVPAGNPIALGIIGIPFVLAALGIGLLISTVAQNQSQAMQMTQFTVLPSILLSGYVSPRETMPGWLYALSNVLPATHFMQVSRGILVRGGSFLDFSPQIFILCCFAVGLVLLATSRFRKSLS